MPIHGLPRGRTIRFVFPLLLAGVLLNPGCRKEPAKSELTLQSEFKEKFIACYEKYDEACLLSMLNKDSIPDKLLEIHLSQLIPMFSGVKVESAKFAIHSAPESAVVLFDRNVTLNLEPKWDFVIKSVHLDASGAQVGESELRLPVGIKDGQVKFCGMTFSEPE